MRNIKNRRLFTSYVSITVIMSIVLFLFGFFGIFFISSNSIANSFKEDFSVSIFFKENAKKIEIIQLQNELLMSSYIQKLKYISKDDALLIMKEEYGQDFIQELGFNPLVNSIDINLKSEFVEASSLDSISAIISKKKYVDEITYDKNLINSLDELINYCAQKKELKLKYELEKNVNLVKFEKNRIEISFNENLDKDFVKDLSAKLFEWTAERWIITFSKSKGEMSVREKQKNKKNELINEVKNSAIYKKVMEKFPDAELLDVKINKTEEDQND